MLSRKIRNEPFRRISMNVTDEVFLKLVKICKQKNIPWSYVIEEMIRNYIKDEEAQLDLFKEL